MSRPSKGVPTDRREPALRRRREPVPPRNHLRRTGTRFHRQIFDEERAEIPHQAVSTFEYRRLDRLGLLFVRYAGRVPAPPPSAQKRAVAVRRCPPDVMGVRALHLRRAAPLRSVCGPRSVPDSFVEVQGEALLGQQPGTGVDEQRSLEDEEVGVARVAAWDAKGECLGPTPTVIALENDDPGGARDAVAVGRAPEGQVESARVGAEIREGVVVGILANGC